MIEIRPANQGDLDWLVGELREFDKFYGAKKSLFGDEGYVRNALLLTMKKHLLLVAVKDGLSPVGFISGFINEHFFNPSIRVLSELFWWVMPAHRRTMAGSMLLNEFIKHGEKNADWITFTLEHKSPVNERIFLKRGFNLQEKIYLKEVC